MLLNVCTCGASLKGVPTWVTTNCPSCGKELVRKVGRMRGPARVERATRKDFAEERAEHMVTTPDGQVMTKSEFRRYWAEVKRQSRDAEFDMYAEDIGATRLEDFDFGEPLTTPKMFICGCDRNASFKTNLPGLKSLRETAQKMGKTVHCPRCINFDVDARMRSQIEERGGALAEQVEGLLSAVKWYKVSCREGHIFEVNGTTLDRGSWCPECFKKAREQRADAVLAERGAEFGLDLVERSDAPGTHLFADAMGAPVHILDTHIKTRPPIAGTTPFAATLYYKDGYGFLLIGDAPVALPAVLADMVRDGNGGLIEVFGTKKAAHAARPRLLSSLSEKCRMLNVLDNPQWRAPGEYTWGTMPAFAGTLRPVGLTAAPPHSVELKEDV